MPARLSMVMKLALAHSGPRGERARRGRRLMRAWASLGRRNSPGARGRRVPHGDLPGTARGADRRRLRRLHHRDADQQALEGGPVVAGFPRDAADDQGTGGRPPVKIPRRDAGSDHHRPDARALLALVRAPRALRARPQRSAPSGLAPVSISASGGPATSASGTRPTACARASTRRSTATCRGSGWPPWASTCRSARQPPRPPSGSARARTTGRQCRATNATSVSQITAIDALDGPAGVAGLGLEVLIAG